MKKRTYRKVPIKSVTVEQVLQRLGERRRLVLAVDVAKTDMVAVLWDPGAEHEQRALFTVSWKQPQEQAAVERLLAGLQRHAVVVEAAMEPSGTYRDALRAMLLGLGIEVYRVSTHRSHRAAEVYDGVPSLHDAKSAQNVAQLHQDGLSQRWSMPSEQERTRSCAMAMMDLYKGERQREINRLEAMLSRHWPELLGWRRKRWRRWPAFREPMRRLRALSKRDAQACAMATTVGVATAAVLVHDIGSPEQFPSARAYLKAAGLNLREKSSGKYRGKLKLTKRGPSRARRYLWLAVLRLLQERSARARLLRAEGRSERRPQVQSRRGRDAQARQGPARQRSQRHAVRFEQALRRLAARAQLSGPAVAIQKEVPGSTLTRFRTDVVRRGRARSAG
jgi:transposase